jgi:hypothetical protein
MNNTQKLIIAQRKFIKYLSDCLIGCHIDKAKPFEKYKIKIAKLEKKIIKKENK